MAIDRAVILRNAEKLIRQGKLEGAIAEYVRIVEDAPGDWNVANTLGDLYARAGQVDKAIGQYIQIADSLNDEGAVAKAGALYKKILKLKPEHEHTLLQLSEILAGQRLYADARAHLTTVLEQRRGRGDVRGVLQIRVRIGSIDPEDFEARLGAAAARKEMGDVAGAHGDLKEIAGELADKGRSAEAIEALREAATLNPHDEEIREKLLDIYFASSDFARARECATSVEQFRLIAAALEGQGNVDEALATLRQAASLNPEDGELRTELARTLLGRGDLAGAAEYLTEEVAGTDPQLLLLVAEMHLRGGRRDEGLALARRLLEEDGARRDQIAKLGWTVAEQDPEAGHQIVEIAAEAAVALGDWAAAAAALQEFVTRVPNHVPTLMRLVEICVDGGLEATMYSAQGQLADAYIASGAAVEARYIAEDLVAREPWEKANIERFRQTLVLLGEPDPDALIAERLSGEAPFMTTDLSVESDDLTTYEEIAAAVDAADPAQDLLLVELDEPTFGVEAGPSPAATGRRKAESHHFELSANAIDLESILGGIEEPDPAPAEEAVSEEGEVDLSIVLDDIKPPAPAVASSGDLGSVFQNMREDSSRRSGLDDAEKEYKRGLALREAGDLDGCIQALSLASRAPRLRFATSWLIARLYRDREDLPHALEWLERAAQAPAPTSDDGQQLMFELADGLEKVGESARSLAVLLELQSEAGSYRDVATRIDRLTKVQAQG